MCTSTLGIRLQGFRGYDIFAMLPRLVGAGVASVEFFLVQGVLIFRLREFGGPWLKDQLSIPVLDHETLSKPLLFRPLKSLGP